MLLIKVVSHENPIVCKTFIFNILLHEKFHIYTAIVEDYETAKEILHSPDWTSRFPSHPQYKAHMFGKNLGKSLVYVSIYVLE